MNEIQKISRDVRSGALPVSEIPNFALYLIARNLGKLSIVIAIGFALVAVLR